MSEWQEKYVWIVVAINCSSVLLSLYKKSVFNLLEGECTYNISSVILLCQY